MHLCFLCNEYPPDPHGGIGSFTRTLGRALVKRGHRVTVVGYTIKGTPGTTDDDGVRVVRLPHAPLRGTGLMVNSLRLSRALVEIDKQQAIDVVEGPEASLVACPRSLCAPAVIRMHGGHHFFSTTLGGKPRLQRSWIEKKSFARATHLCAVSNFVASKTLELLHLTHRPVEVIPNPVNTVTFAPIRPVREDDSLIVFAGTVTEKKGIRQLVEAMARVIDAVPSARLSILGRDSREPSSGGSYTAWLRQRIPAGIADHISFEGPVAHGEMPERLARAAVCVYPSHMEAMPLAWLEGMAMGKCVVASQTGPGPEVIEHGVTGLLCDPHDPAAIAARLISALTAPALRQRLGRAARARVKARFAENVIVERNERFYERCVRSPIGPISRRVTVEQSLRRA